MNTFNNPSGKMTNFRWLICGMLFFATAVNYLLFNGEARSRDIRDDKVARLAERMDNA